MSKLGIATGKTHIRPHFTVHTQSSLMKTRMPIKVRKSLSTKDANESKKPRASVALKLGGIHKRRSNVVMQNRSMQMMLMILKQHQPDRRTTIFLSGSELTETTFRANNSFASLQSDLIKDVSHDLQKRAGSSTELATLRDKPTRVVDESEKVMENLHASLKDGANAGCTHNLENIPEIETQGVNAATNREYTQKIWTSKKAWNERVDVDGARPADLQTSEGTKHIDNPQDKCPTTDKLVVGDNNATSWRKVRKAPQKNPASGQRAWKPPGVSKTWSTESATFLQPMSQRSSKLAKRSAALSRSEHSSTEYVEASISESTSTSISTDQFKTLMKENANRMTKICEHLAEAKQRQRLQSGGTLPKRRRSKTKVGTQVSNKCNNANPIQKTKARHCQTRPIVPKKSSTDTNVEQTDSLTCSQRLKTYKVLDALKKIDSTEDSDTEENAMSNDFDHEKGGSKIQTSSSHDTFIFTENVSLDGANRTSRRSVSTQTELDLPCQKIDAEKDQGLKEVLKPTRIVATQTSPSCNRNVVEIGCNTSSVVYKDNSKTKVEPIGIGDTSILDDPIHMESSSFKHIESVENKDANRKLPLSGCKKILNTELEKLENYNSMTNDAAREAEKIMREEACQISLEPPKSSDDETNIDIDKHQKPIKYFNHGANSTSVNNLFSARSRPSIYSYDASCSSEEITEYLENDSQYGDTITSELKVNNVPSDVIAAFELAAERARNIHEAVIICYQNLPRKMARESRKQNEDIIKHSETSEFHDDRRCLGTRTVSGETEGKIKYECEAKYHFANDGGDFGGFLTCSSRGSSSDRICELEKFSRAKDYLGIDREEENEQAIARSVLNECSSFKDVRSLMQLVTHRAEEEYALELLQLEGNGNESEESFEMAGATNGTLALPAAINKTYLIAPKSLLLLIYCVVCTVVFWFLQFSFRCDSAK
ncbi:PREDICTED: uncharacterized protein LOC105570499 [Vollenhovia emeryi]|uniref:uncharacterized protein LOC105570499 n=1 Tax=Vollenhovia emeryi TaxID=411798 RepID=UPI0005F53302|nr:PREDICTED: uncharacterized protein LOC105570499 [Vollenhovia emeryi]